MPPPSPRRDPPHAKHGAKGATRALCLSQGTRGMGSPASALAPRFVRAFWCVLLILSQKDAVAFVVCLLKTRTAAENDETMNDYGLRVPFPFKPHVGVFLGDSRS